MPDVRSETHTFFVQSHVAVLDYRRMVCRWDPYYWTGTTTTGLSSESGFDYLLRCIQKFHE